MRRLIGGLAAGVTVTIAAWVPAHGRSEQVARPELRVVVLSLDGLRPSEVNPVVMPNVAAFRAESTWYEQSRSVMIAETIPNHVAMMTGVYPDRSGIPANDYWDRTGDPESSDLEVPEELEAPTLFTTLANACPDSSTAAVLSKRYLYNIFRTGGINVAPDTHWRPEPLIANDVAPAVSAQPQITAALEAGVDFLFINLGDIDRAGHVDTTGPTLGELGAMRMTAKAEVDLIAGQVFDQLKADSRWLNTVVIVVSDHGFDWSLPTNVINPQAVLDATPATAGRFFTATASGVSPIYLIDPTAADAAAVLVAGRAALVDVTGVADVWYRQPNALDPAGDAPADLHLDHPNAGDLILLPEAGWRTSSPEIFSNPLPGSHGNFPTRHATFMIGGGAPYLAGPQTITASASDPENRLALPEQSENVDVAPTTAELFGLPTDIYDGRVLTEAFATDPNVQACGAPAASASPVAGPTSGTTPGAGGSSTTGGFLPATGTSDLVVPGALVATAAAALWKLRQRAGEELDPGDP